MNLTRDQRELSWLVMNGDYCHIVHKKKGKINRCEDAPEKPHRIKKPKPIARKPSVIKQEKADILAELSINPHRKNKVIYDALVAKGKLKNSEGDVLVVSTFYRVISKIRDAKKMPQAPTKNSETMALIKKGASIDEIKQVVGSRNVDVTNVFARLKISLRAYKRDGSVIDL